MENASDKQVGEVTPQKEEKIETKKVGKAKNEQKKF